MVGQHRTPAGRKEKTSFIIVDAQSVKNTETAEHKGYDAGKKVSGIKRHIAVDTEGLPHAITITTANISDKAGAKQMVANHSESLNEVLNVLVDGGYTGNPFSEFIAEKLNATVEVAKRSELQTFTVIPKRWVVERSFAWVERCRRLWKTVSANFPHLWQWSSSHSSHYYLGDFKQLLRACTKGLTALAMPDQLSINY